ncbi:hypothetical protein HDV06_000431 [Boothiomyces sp. JEL0866]|nr:hypothetical protein HDV06_000431 [Boothiomyces sp. JEL0866]
MVKEKSKNVKTSAKAGAKKGEGKCKPKSEKPKGKTNNPVEIPILKTKSVTDQSKEPAPPCVLETKMPDPEPPCVLETKMPDPEPVIGNVFVRFNHYNQPFPIKNGALDGNLVDDKYAFSFVHKGSFQLILRDDQGNEMKQPSRFNYSELEDGKSYTIQVVPDPEIESKRQYGTGVKLNEAKKQNNKVDLITKELKAMTIDQLMEKGERYKELIEARELEACLYS